MKSNVFERDKILSKGYGYRKNAWILFQVCAVGLLAMIMNNIWMDLLLLGLNAFGLSYVLRYRHWVRDNREYIVRKGYEAR